MKGFEVNNNPSWVGLIKISFGRVRSSKDERVRLNRGKVVPGSSPLDSAIDDRKENIVIKSGV